LNALANSQAMLPSQMKSISQQARKYQKLTQDLQECLQLLNNSELAVMPFLRQVAHRIEIAI